MSAATPGHQWVADMPDAYDRLLVPITFRPFAVELARRIAEQRPRRVLELAAGTGVLTADLVALAEQVVATDLNAAMVEFGRRHVPQATWQQADAMRLPFPDGLFDAVVCQFGVMFLPDRPAAFAEARRQLRPGGALTFSTWGALAGHSFEAAFDDALARVLPGDPPRFLRDVPHGYADPDAIVADVRRGGFSSVALDTVTLPTAAASAADIATGYCTGTPVRATIEARADLSQTVASVTSLLEESLGQGPLRGTMTAHVVAATP